VLHPGEILDGYRLIRPIGSGGFGEVWLCQSDAIGDFRALKFIPATSTGHLEKEFDSICKYRAAATQLRSPSLMPIEHVNRRSDGLFYIMPLSDGYGVQDPTHEEWYPLTMAAILEGRRSESTWFTSEEIRNLITPILQALQLLSDAGLVHRDVKPENILFVNSLPCLGDISLLGKDTSNLTQRGTPGYSAPSWFVESGGHPDMYGSAMTLYAILTGNPPDKMGRAAFRWPPQGEQSLSATEREAWLMMHRAIRRAVEDRPAERFVDFVSFQRSLSQEHAETKKDTRKVVYGVCAFGAAILFGGLIFFSNHHNREQKPALNQTPNEKPITGEAMARVKTVEEELARVRQEFTFPREKFASDMSEIASALAVYDAEDPTFNKEKQRPLPEIKKRFLEILKALPPKPDSATRIKVVESLRSMVMEVGRQYGEGIKKDLDDQLAKLEMELNTDSDFRKEQGAKVLKRATRLVNNLDSWDIIRPAQKLVFYGDP
jgi:serine/threonine protein kinase